jgi:hypothetical protein
MTKPVTDKQIEDALTQLDPLRTLILLHDEPEVQDNWHHLKRPNNDHPRRFRKR